MNRALVLILVLSLGAGIAGCRPKASSDKPPAATAPGAPAPGPLTFAQSTPDAMAKLTMSPEFNDYPGLRAKLYGDGVRELTSFISEAHNDHQRMAAEGAPQQQYERTIDWTITARTPLLTSAREAWFISSGGAHPNSGADTLLWDVVGDREIFGRDLFKPRADHAKLDGVLCDAVKTAKIQRDGAVWDPKTWPCPMWFDSDFVFAPSTEKDKIGGLTFLFDPYAIGPYVEGDYAVTVPFARFKDAVSPLYASVFAGDPQPGPAAPAG